MAETVKCSQGHENELGDKFCGKCAERLSGGRMKCPHCNETIESGSKFCGKCGKPTQEDRKTETKGLKWQRGHDDFATRIDIEDLSSAFQLGIIIEHGTKALLLENGALACTLQPGYYEMRSFIEALKESAIKGGGAVVRGVVSHLLHPANKDKREHTAETINKAIDTFLAHDCTVILVDAGDVELKLNVTEIKTKDPLNIDVVCMAIAQIDNTAFFLSNVLKGRKSYFISELRGSLYDELSNALREAVGRKSVSELNWDLSLKKQFEVSIENHLRTTFQRNGINFVQLRTLDYNFKHFNKIKGIEEATFLQVSEDEANLKQRKRFFDVYDQAQLQEIVEEAREVELREKRQKVWADMRALVNSDKMNEIKSADDLEAYLHEINKGKFLREDEVQELLNTFKQGALRREFLLEKLELEQRLEAQRIGMVGHEENKLAQWEVQAKRERRELDERIKSQKDLKAAEREIKVEGATADAKVKDLEREADEKDLELGLKGLKAVKELKLKEKREEMEIETDRLRRLSELGVEALITAAGPEQAKMLAELKKTELLKGMSEEQILAMAAGNSDAVAKAFEEKYKGLSAAKQEELYREMMKQKDISMSTMQQMFDKALETQRDATVGVAQGGRVVYPPQGQPGFYGGPMVYNTGQGAPSSPQGAEETVICAKCKSRVKTGVKFCNNCGTEMF